MMNPSTVVLFYIVAFCGVCKAGCVDPEFHMDSLQLINYHGYTGELHTVTTDDGYILEVFRIACGRVATEARNCSADSGVQRTPVFFMHGVMASSDDWLLNLPDQSFPFILADAGYDVWLGNNRGNRYGRQHERLTPWDDEFWQFSFDESAQYDLPNMIDYVRHATNKTSVYLVSHSQGACITFIHGSQQPSFREKVKHHFALGPVAKIENVKGPLKYIAPLASTIDFAMGIFGLREFTLPKWLMKSFSFLFCGTSAFGRKECASTIFLIAGPDSVEMNRTRVPVYMSHEVAGTSVQNMVHWAQMIRSGKFRAYDYGRRTNLEKYGQATPPVYPLSNYTLPTSLFYGANDWLADPTDVESTLVPLPSVEHVHKYDTYNHVDFQWAVSANKVLYPEIMAKMNALDGM